MDLTTISTADLLEIAALLKYSEDEARDAGGRWTSGGGGDVGAAIAASAPSGGWSVHPYRATTARSGYQVAIVGRTRQYDASILKDHAALSTAVQSFLDKNQDILKPGGNVYIGGWTHEGVLFLEPSEHIMGLAEAVKLGEQRDQISIWDNARKVEIQTGGTGVVKGPRLDPGRLGDDDRRTEEGSVGQDRAGDHGWPVLKRDVSDEARDETGKWTGGGSSVTVTLPGGETRTGHWLYEGGPGALNMTPVFEAAKARAAELYAQFPGPNGVPIAKVDWALMDPALSARTYAGNPTALTVEGRLQSTMEINLTPRPEGGVEEKGWSPRGCADTPANAITHEFGHAVANVISDAGWVVPGDTLQVWGHTLNTCTRYPVSGYARTDKGEGWAEAFLAAYAPDSKATETVSALAVRAFMDDNWTKITDAWSKGHATLGKRARTITITSGGRKRDAALEPIKARVRAQLIALATEHSNRNKRDVTDEARDERGQWSADGEAAMAGWADSLSPAQRRAVSEYKGSGYTPINASLRHAPDEHRFASTVRQIDAAIAKGTLPAPVTVYRGASSRNLPAGNMKGSIFTDRGFLSTSFDENIPRLYMHRTVGGVEAPALLRLSVPAGAHAGYTSFERELLLPRDSQFRVTSDRTAGKVRYIDAELVQ